MRNHQPRFAVHVGFVRSVKCRGCQQVVTERQTMMSGFTRPHWVMDPHKAPCGLHCYDSFPVPARYAEHCHSANGCPLCPPQSKRRTRGRPRTKSEVTQAAILGQLSITELRLIAYMTHYPTSMAHSVACVRMRLKLAARTVGDAFRALAARGIVSQDERRKWRINSMYDWDRSLLRVEGLP